MNENRNPNYVRPDWIWKYYRKEKKVEKLKAYISSLKPEEPLNLPENLKYLLKQKDIKTQTLLAKYLLVFGMDVSQVAMRSGLPLKVIRDIEPYYNERLRKTTHISLNSQIALAVDMWETGRDIEEICTRLDMPVYTLLVKMKERGYPSNILKSRLPPDDHPLMKQLHRTNKNKKKG